MKYRAFSIALALCLCASSAPNTYAWQASPLPQEHILAAQLAGGRTADTQGDVPTPQEVYETLIALKEQDGYKEETPWTDATHSYIWNGGPIDGNVTGGTGCVAFAFKLSDLAFGNLRARMYTDFAFSDVKVGDILRVNGGAHTVIVLQVTEEGVTIAEGNYNSMVHWGRSLTKAQVEDAVSLITRYPEGYIPPDDSSSNEPIEGGSGTLAGGLAWKLTKAGTLTISGNGAMPDFSADQPWNIYADKILKIVIENGVTSVGNNAFQGSKALGVVIPASVKTIGSNAFRSCSSLISVTMSEGVETIGDNAFRGCVQLKTMALPSSVLSVGSGVFMDCVELTQVVFAPGGQKVQMGDSLFARCRTLTKVILPSQVDRIGEGMFMDCLLLSNVNIPQGAESIGMSAFASCGRLTSVTIPDSVTQIGMAAFSACGITDIYFGGSEAQWAAIQKLGDTSGILANVNIHYDATDPTPDPEPEPDPGPGHTHSWGDGTITKPASCTASGTRTYICTGCEEIRTETISALGHNYEISPETKQATCTKDGRETSVCSRCDDVQTKVVPATGHHLVHNSDGDYECTNELDSSGESSMTVTSSVGDGYFAVKGEDGHRAPYAYQDTSSAQQHISELVRKALSAVDSHLSGTITTIRFTPPTRTMDGEYVYQVTIRSGARAAAFNLTTEPLSMVIPANSAPVPSPEPEPSPRPDTESEETYSVNILKTTGGQVTSNYRSAAQGGQVIVFVQPNAGYELAELTVTDGQGRNVPVRDMGGSKYRFNMPSVKVDIKAVFTASVPASSGKPLPFTDVMPSAWYYSGVEYVRQHQLMNGVSDTLFAPHQTASRAMIWTILARMNGVSTSVASGSLWYEKGMRWAMEQGVTDGSSPMEDITREQLALMLWRNAGSVGSSTSLGGFSDAAAISGYAVDAVQWAAGCGILQGSGGLLNPKGTATRAEVAVMLMRYAAISPGA